MEEGIARSEDFGGGRLSQPEQSVKGERETIGLKPAPSEDPSQKSRPGGASRKKAGISRQET